MSYFTTGLDLKTDALWLAGEPTDGTSPYDSRAYEWMTVCQRTIVSGGMFGPSVLQPADWYWARAWPRGAIQLVQPFGPNARLATFTLGSQTVTLQGSAVPDLTGYRVLRSTVPARHMIVAVDNTVTNFPTLTLKEPWTGASVSSVGDWLAYPDTYLLPDDFVRGTSPLFLYGFPSNLPTTQTIDVVDPSDLERMYPQAFPWAQGTSTVGGGLPLLAARVTDSRIRFSHFLQTQGADLLPLQLEFEYLRRPDVILEGVHPLVPLQHRRILSYGAAALILQDKNDADAANLFAFFSAQYKAMRDEHASDMRRMSIRWGVIQPPRASGNRSIILTETGLPVYLW